VPDSELKGQLLAQTTDFLMIIQIPALNITSFFNMISSSRDKNSEIIYPITKKKIQLVLN